MLLLALAVAPGIAIMWYIYLKDKYDREPLHYLIVSFFLGMLSTLPAIAIQMGSSYVLGDVFAGDSIGMYAFYAFFIVALSEEFSKYLMLRYFAYRKKEFNEPFDGIVYGVMISMGFATLENILYVQQHGFGTAIVRMFVSVPAHGTFGILMGYYVGLAKFARPNQRLFLWRGLATAVFFHGAFDFFLFLQQNTKVTVIVSQGLLAGAAIISFLIAARLSRKAIRLHQELSRLDFEKRNNI
ncbi:MAG: PrsW family intramembrane metalloprotease [Gemmatimonadaceae bacterium]|nr:PrsW family intramembrane metalloprotease [Chitinophagaceae bacterium]